MTVKNQLYGPSIFSFYDRPISSPIIVQFSPFGLSTLGFQDRSLSQTAQLKSFKPSSSILDGQVLSVHFKLFGPSTHTHYRPHSAWSVYCNEKVNEMVKCFKHVFCLANVNWDASTNEFDRFDIRLRLTLSSTIPCIARLASRTSNWNKATWTKFDPGHGCMRICSFWIMTRKDISVSKLSLKVIIVSKTPEYEFYYDLIFWSLKLLWD